MKMSNDLCLEYQFELKRLYDAADQLSREQAVEMLKEFAQLYFVQKQFMVKQMRQELDGFSQSSSLG